MKGVFAFLSSILIFSSLLTQQILKAQSPSKINQSYIYATSPEIFFSSRLAMLEDQVMYYANIAFSLNTKLNEYEITWQWIKSYESSLKEGETIKSEYFKSTSDRHYSLSLPLKKGIYDNVLVIEFINYITKSRHIFTTDFHKKYTLWPSEFHLSNEKDITLTSLYITTKQPFKIKTIGNSTLLKVQYFAKDYKIPRFPYNTTGQIQRFNADSVFEINIDKMYQLDNEGFYLFSKLLKDKTTLGWRVEKPNYPKLIHIEELIPPLQYISYPLEYQIIQRSTSPRQAFENFWSGLFPNKETCKNMIRQYYERVKIANILFTSYKKGWKEDKGMIYIVFGPPNIVNINDREEIWEYKKNKFSLKRKFVFKKNKNKMMLQTQTLQRSTSYDNIWENEVKRWRKGKILR